MACRSRDLRSRGDAIARLAAVLTAALLLALVAVVPAEAAPSLSVSPRDGLSPSGATAVQVQGSGYDTSKGIYVAYCVAPAAGQVPSPCGGGADMSGTSGGSVWFSNDPPPYGEGLAKPYGASGSFSATVQVTPRIGDVDCTTTRCAVVTRNDHTRNSDRSQDVVVPVSFAEPEPEPTTEPEQEPTTEPTPTPTAAPTPPTEPSPTAEPAPTTTSSSTPSTSSNTSTDEVRADRADDDGPADGEDPPGGIDDGSTPEDEPEDGSEDADDGSTDEDEADLDGGEPGDDETHSGVDDAVVAVGAPDGTSGGAAVWVTAGSLVAIGAGVGTFLVRRRRATAP